MQNWVLQTVSGEQITDPILFKQEVRAMNSPQWRGWWWVWRCSAPPPPSPPPPCSAPPPEEEGLCRSPSPTDAATPTESLWLNNNNNNTPTTQYTHIYEATLICGTVILVSGFLSSILSMSSFRSLVMAGLGGKWHLCCSRGLYIAHFCWSGLNWNCIQQICVCLRVWKLHAFVLDLVVQRDDVFVVEGTLFEDK